MIISNSYYTKPPFKGIYLADTGAGNSSEYSGNVAGKGETDNGKEVILESHPIPKSKTPEEFTANWAKIVATMIPKNDKNTKIVAPMPGPSNLNTNGKQEVTLTNLGMLKITPDMLKKALKKEGVAVKKLLVINDGHLHNTNILNANKDFITGPEFIGGLNLFPGGGFGCATFRKEGNKFVSTVAERGNEIFPGNMVKTELLTEEKKKKVNRLGVNEYSTTAPSVVRNFAKALGFNDKDAKVLAETKEGRLITQHKIKFDITDSEEITQSNALKETGLVKDLGRDKNTQVLMLKNPNGIGEISKKQHSQASNIAVGEFFKGIGIVLSRWETQNMGTDVFVPTKLASKLAESIGKDNAVKIVQETAWDNLTDMLRNNIVKSPQNQKVHIKDLGEPTSIKNLKSLLSGKSPKGDGFREIKIPLKKD